MMLVCDNQHVDVCRNANINSMNHKYCSTNSGISQETELEKNTLYSSENNLHSGSTSFTKCANLLHNPLPELAEVSHHDHHNYPLSIVHYSLLIVLCLLFSVNAMAEFGGGTGSESDPYIISTITHLRTLADNVNGNEHYSGMYFKVTENISGMEKVIGYNSSSKYFSGIFDGNNKTITLAININASGSPQYVGLFGKIVDATIKNVNVAGSISFNNWYTGGIAGIASNSTIENCTCSANITTSFSFTAGIVGQASNTTITDCKNINNTISGGGTLVGGIGGSLTNCTISNCSNEGTVTGPSANQYRGGLLGGSSSNTITDCYNIGNVVGTISIGGIVGWSSATTIINTYNRGEVKGTENVGGIVGSVINNAQSSVKNCYNTGKVTRTSGSSGNFGGIIGNCGFNIPIENCYSGNTISASTTYKGGIVGFLAPGTVGHCYYRKGDGVTNACYHNSGTESDTAYFTHTDGNTTCTLRSNMYGTTVMLNALNAWVEANQVGDTYKKWVADNGFENRGMPIFYTCTPIVTTISNVNSSYSANTITWTSDNPAYSYTIYWGASGSLNNTISGQTSPYNHTGLTNGIEYCYRVVAVGTGDYCDVNEPSAQVCGTPHCTHLDAPTLNIQSTGNRFVTVSWETVSGAVSYRLNYGSNSSNMWEVTPDSNPYTVLRLTNDQTYNFKIKAVGDEEHCGEDNPFSTPLKQATPNCP